jgi:hypothetical protein
MSVTALVAGRPAARARSQTCTRVLRVAQEALAGRRQPRPGLVADEQPAAELVLERTDPGAHRRLGDVETAGGGNKAARLGDLEESPGLRDIHRLV